MPLPLNQAWLFHMCSFTSHAQLTGKKPPFNAQFRILQNLRKLIGASYWIDDHYWSLLLMEETLHQLIGTVVYPIIYRVLYIPGGAGILPSTVSLLGSIRCYHSKCWILYIIDLLPVYLHSNKLTSPSYPSGKSSYPPKGQKQAAVAAILRVTFKLTRPFFN